MKKNKEYLIVVISFLFCLSCKENNSSDRAKDENTLLSNVVLTNEKTEENIIEGVYFLENIENKNCDFWLTILKEKKNYSYAFFRNNKIDKTGKLGVINEGKNLKFSEGFTCLFSNGNIVIQNYGNSIESYERIPYCDLKYIELTREIKFNNENIIFYNDKAYYLEQEKQYSHAVFLLEKIVKQFPNRIVAYINLGDAYWGLGNYEKAKLAYKVYIRQMKENGKENKIPKVIFKRIE